MCLKVCFNIKNIMGSCTDHLEDTPAYKFYRFSKCWCFFCYDIMKNKTCIFWFVFFELGSWYSPYNDKVNLELLPFFLSLPLKYGVVNATINLIQRVKADNTDKQVFHNSNFSSKTQMLSLATNTAIVFLIDTQGCLFSKKTPAK